MQRGVLSGWQQQWSFDVSFLARPANRGNALSPPIRAKQFFAASTCCAEARTAYPVNPSGDFKAKKKPPKRRRIGSCFLETRNF
jgi:hypothetical protein